MVADLRRFWTVLLLLVALALFALFVEQGSTAPIARNTVLLCAAVCAISLPVGSLLALLIVRTDLPGRRLVGWLLGCMLFVPLYVQAAAWEAGFGLQGGVTLNLASGVWLEGFPAAIWVHAVAAIPWVAVFIGAGFWLVERELEEVALLDAGPMRVFLAVTVPRSLAAFAVAAIWIAIDTASEMTVTDLFNVRAYAEQLYLETALGGTLGEAPRAMLPSILVVAWLLAAGLWLCVQMTRHFDRPTAGRGHVFSLGRWRWPCAGLVGAIMVAVAGVPVASLAYKAGVSVVQTDAGRVRSWSLVRCLQTTGLSIPAYREEIGWTLAVGCLAATISLLLAVPLAWSARRGGWPALPAVVITALLLAIPAPVLGIGVIWLLNRPDPAWLTMLYDHPLVALSVVQCGRALPLVTLICWAAFRSLPRETLETAATIGAGPVTRLVRVGLPQRRAALAAAWWVALALSVDELAASILVAPPGVTTLSIQVFNQLHYGAESQVAGICLAMLTTYAFAGLLVACLLRQITHRRRNRPTPG